MALNVRIINRRKISEAEAPRPPRLSFSGAASRVSGCGHEPDGRRPVRFVCCGSSTKSAHVTDPASALALRAMPIWSRTGAPTGRMSWQSSTDLAVKQRDLRLRRARPKHRCCQCPGGCRLSSRSMPRLRGPRPGPPTCVPAPVLRPYPVTQVPIGRAARVRSQRLISSALDHVRHCNRRRTGMPCRGRFLGDLGRC